MSIIVSRRTMMLSTTAALLGATTELSVNARKAAAQTARIRPAAHTLGGKRALLSYRKGVEVMRQRSRDNFLDPTGWSYQALIHGILSRQPRAEFLQLVFGGAPPNHPVRLLAEACWATCPHSTIEFLPWHRIYVYFLERIVRDASGDPDFMLPYWNYSLGGAHAEVPIEFREAVNGSPLNNSLFTIARDPEMNGVFGAPKRLPTSDVALEALRQPVFEATAERQGFSAAVEGTPHNLVHGDIGGGDDLGFPIGDMSVTTTAGRDPIFWLHHANMDRLWESWLRAGGETASSYSDRAWYAQKWTFVNEAGDRQELSLKDLDALLASEPIEYEQYENIPRDQVPLPAPAAVASSTVAAASDTTLVLSPKGNRVEFGAAPTASFEAVPSMEVHSARVVLEDIEVTSERAVTFDVYLNLASPAEKNEKALVGSFNFFGAVHDGTAHPQRYIFDVTKMVQASVAQGDWPANPSITILPRNSFVGQPAKIGNVRLVIE